jgi:hypothetical protein
VCKCDFPQTIQIIATIVFSCPGIRCGKVMASYPNRIDIKFLELCLQSKTCALCSVLSPWQRGFRNCHGACVGSCGSRSSCGLTGDGKVSVGSSLLASHQTLVSVNDISVCGNGKGTGIITFAVFEVESFMLSAPDSLRTDLDQKVKFVQYCNIGLFKL